jgi:diguanylate cyclase (GGDEF)-like protein/PAS domain S-box-containing protein
MTLHKKTLILLGTALITLVIVLYLISKTVFLKSYGSLEEQHVRAHIELALKTLSEIVSAQDSKAGDWANWDETYDFINTGNREYTRTNPTDKTFSELKINLMLFVNASGKVIFGKAFDLQNQIEIPVPKSILNHIETGSILLLHAGSASGRAGIIILPEGPMIITSRPILTSEGKGPVRGTLLFGRYLDETEIRKLGEEPDYALSVHRADDEQMPQDLRSAVLLFSEKNQIRVKPVSPDFVAGHTILQDIYGNPALILEIRFKRDIFRQGEKTVYYFISLIIIAGLLLGIATMFMLDREVLSRITGLSSHVRRVRASGDLSERLPPEGRDELSGLSIEINKMLEELEKSEENYRNLFENANDLIQSVDADGRFLSVNKKWRSTLGYTADEAKKMHFTDIIKKDQIPHCMEILKKIAMGELADLTETIFISKDGKELHVEGSINAQHSDGKFICTRGIFRDVTFRKQMEQTLRESEEKFKAISSTAKDAIIMMDDKGGVTYWNRAAEEIFGYPEGEIIGKELHGIIAPERHHEPHRKGMETFRAEGRGHAVGKTTELTGLRKGGIEFPVELSLSSVKLNERWHAVGIVRDITTRRDLEAKLHYMSYRDELTGLYNRRGFTELAQQQLKMAERNKSGMLLLFADVDNLKQINDKYGHQEGDRVIREAAAVLKGTFRDSDIVARLGGDEFAALTLETGEENADILYNRLKDHLAYRNETSDFPYSLSLSVGIAYYDPLHPETIDTLLAQGDQLMYHEKQRKRNVHSW